MNRQVVDGESGRDSADRIEQIRLDIGERLRSRSSEIVDAVYARVRDAVPDPVADLGADYQSGVLAATAALVEYGLDGIAWGSDWSASIPQAAAAQVRRAARVGVSLSIVQRRSFVGHRCLGEFVAQEAESIGIASHFRTMHHLHTTRQALLEHLMAALEHEYDDECRAACSPEQRRIELVQRLLVEDVDQAELKGLDYAVASCWHLGVIAIGAEGAETLRRLGASLGRQLLSVAGDDDGTVWAWLGSKTKLSVAEFKCLLSTSGCRNAPFAIGDPGSGLEGWRHTHHEAQLALLVAHHKPQEVTRCADVLPVVGALQNEAMIGMYEKVYILPLNSLHGNGLPARKSLLAYFEHGRNVSSAGKAIGVNRRTVENHLSDVRKVLGDLLDLTALEIALRLEELGYMDAGPEALRRRALSALHHQGPLLSET